MLKRLKLIIDLAIQQRAHGNHRLDAHLSNRYSNLIQLVNLFKYFRARSAPTNHVFLMSTGFYMLSFSVESHKI